MTKYSIAMSNPDPEKAAQFARSADGVARERSGQMSYCKVLGQPLLPRFRVCFLNIFCTCEWFHFLVDRIWENRFYIFRGSKGSVATTGQPGFGLDQSIPCFFVLKRFQRAQQNNLWEKCDLGEVEELRELFLAGADPNTRGGSHKRTCLMIAIIRHVHHDKDNLNCTALHYVGRRWKDQSWNQDDLKKVLLGRFPWRYLWGNLVQKR